MHEVRGGEHFAKDCRANPDGCDYKCGRCNANARITNNGASVTTQTLRAPEPSCASSSSSSTVVPAKRPAEVALRSSVPMKIAKTPPKNTHVLVCRINYITLALYLGEPNPTPKEVALAKGSCSESRLEIASGDTKTSQARGYV